MDFTDFLAAAIGITLGICFIAYLIGSFALLLFLREHTFTRFFPVLFIVTPMLLGMFIPAYPPGPSPALELIAPFLFVLWSAFGIVGNFILVFRCRFWFKRAIGSVGLLLILSPIAAFLDSLMLR